ncbi:MAG: hypothetical protein CME60_10570 [Halobacteriovoraceae bacterium]|nr:hypothetical protein [Halobacteriovoraceae bacterium]
MIKTWSHILLLFLSHSVFAGQGIITTLEAPIMSNPSMTSQVRQLIRKGEKLYIHDKHFRNGPLEISYDNSADTGFFPINMNDKGEGFYQTKDRNGQTAYISTRYVKLITHDVREFTQNITPYNPDPNDYRLEEPLPKNYPLVEKNKYRAVFNFSMGPDLKTNYNYNSVLAEEDFSNHYGFELKYSRKAGWDKENRFYFGGMLRGWTSKSRFRLYNDNRSATEDKSQLGIGPFISYDPWRNKDFTLTFSGGVLFNYDRNLVTQNHPFGEEQRLFSAFTVTPVFSTFAQIQTNVPDLAIVAGIQTQIYLPHSLTTSKEPTLNTAWRSFGSSEDQIDIPFSAQWSAVIGIQSYY